MKFSFSPDSLAVAIFLIFFLEGGVGIPFGLLLFSLTTGKRSSTILILGLSLSAFLTTVIPIRLRLAFGFSTTGSSTFATSSVSAVVASLSDSTFTGASVVAVSVVFSSTLVSVTMTSSVGIVFSSVTVSSTFTTSTISTFFFLGVAVIEPTLLFLFEAVTFFSTGASTFTSVFSSTFLASMFLASTVGVTSFTTSSTFASLTTSTFLTIFGLGFATFGLTPLIA